MAAGAYIEQLLVRLSMTIGTGRHANGLDVTSTTHSSIMLRACSLLQAGSTVQKDEAMSPEGIVVSKILELKEHVGLQSCDRLHKFLHEITVLGSCDARLLYA